MSDRLYSITPPFKRMGKVEIIFVAVMLPIKDHYLLISPLHRHKNVSLQPQWVLQLTNVTGHCLPVKQSLCGDEWELYGHNKRQICASAGVMAMLFPF